MNPWGAFGLGFLGGVAASFVLCSRIHAMVLEENATFRTEVDALKRRIQLIGERRLDGTDVAGRG